MIKQGFNSSVEFLSVRYFAYLAIFFLSLYLSINASDGSDLAIHTQIIEQLGQGRIAVPHFLFHVTVFGLSTVSQMSYFNMACLVMAVCVLVSMAVIERIVRSVLHGRYSDYFLLFVTMALMLVSAVYFPLVNKFPYLGVWSPNPWHNPTYIAARPFVLLATYWYLREVTGGTYFKKHFAAVRISVLLVVIALIKPNFILAFLPAAAIWCFFSPNKLEMLLKTGLMALPVAVVMILQYVFTYTGSADNTSSVQLCFFDVWQIYARSVPLAILQGMAFSTVVLVSLLFYIPRDRAFAFSWILFLFAFLISGLLCETGHRAGHANFIWTYMFALNILFIYSTIAFLRWASETQKVTPSSQIRVSVCISVFLLHLFSGIYYVGYLVSGREI